jgi:Zn finger protein HypA/HybF involved in hydrogenase expression
MKVKCRKCQKEVEDLEVLRGKCRKCRRKDEDEENDKRHEDMMVAVIAACI